MSDALTPARAPRRRVRARVSGLVGSGCVVAFVVTASACGHDVIDLAKTVPLRDAGTDAEVDAQATSSPIITCTTDDDCASVGGVCAFDQGRCVECRENANCPFWAAICDSTTNRCVQCLDSTSCPSIPLGNGMEVKTTCDPELLSCAVPCTTNDDCFAPVVPICDQTRAECVQCETDADCYSRGGAICSYGWCVECVDNSDCPFGTPYCLQGVRCVECLQSDQCGFGYECDSIELRCRATQ